MDAEDQQQQIKDRHYKERNECSEESMSNERVEQEEHITAIQNRRAFDVQMFGMCSLRSNTPRRAHGTCTFLDDVLHVLESFTVLWLVPRFNDP